MAGHRTCAQSSRELFGSEPDLRPSIVLPYRVKRITRWVSGGSGITLEQLMTQHSAWPLFRLCASSSADDIEPIIRSDGHPGRRKQAEMLRVLLGEHKALRYCPLCVLHDREKYREPYWHLTHQLWGVSLCPVHKVELQTTDIDISKPLHRYVTASDANLATTMAQPDGNQENQQHYLRLSKAITELLKTDVFKSNRDVVAYLEEALQGQMADELLLEVYGVEFLQRFLTDGLWDAVQNALRDRDLTPLSHVAYALLIAAIRR